MIKKNIANYQAEKSSQIEKLITLKNKSKRPSWPNEKNCKQKKTHTSKPTRTSAINDALWFRIQDSATKQLQKSIRHIQIS